MNYNQIFVLLLCFLIIIILLRGIFSYVIYQLKNILKKDTEKRKSKMIEIFIGSFIMGIIFTICFICIIGWITIFVTLIYFCFGAFFGALISLEEPRHSLKDMNEIHD